MTTSPHCSPRDPQAALGLPRGPPHPPHPSSSHIKHWSQSAHRPTRSQDLQTPSMVEHKGYVFRKPPNELISFRSWAGMVRGARSEACLSLDIASSWAQNLRNRCMPFCDHSVLSPWVKERWRRGSLGESYPTSLRGASVNSEAENGVLLCSSGSGSSTIVVISIVPIGLLSLKHRTVMAF
jgi:hypothetical protein